MTVAQTWLSHSPALQVVVFWLGVVFFLAGVVLLVARPARTLLLSKGFVGHVSVSDAVRMIYERCEGTEFSDFLVQLHADPETRLSHIFHAIQRRNIPIFAASPPSHKKRRIVIPRGGLRLIPGTNDMAPSGSDGVAIFTDAFIRRFDVWRLTRELRKTRTT